MNINGKFYIISERDDKIKAAFMTSLPVLWNRDGEFRVVPKAVVQNAIDLHKMYTQQEFKVAIPIITIQWSQGIPISNLAGRALVGE